MFEEGKGSPEGVIYVGRGEGGGGHPIQIDDKWSFKPH